MKRAFLFIIIFVIVGISGILIYQRLSKEENPSKEISMPVKALENKKIVMIIAFRDFRDEEYFVPRRILEEAGVRVVTVSSKKDTAIGADGGEAEVNLLVEEINVADFDAVIFIGGPGALKYLDNDDSYKLAKETISQNKVLAAVCIAPTILAKAGVLKGKKATVWSSAVDKSSVRILEDNGAEYLSEAVVVDGKIITGNGPGAAKEFGEKIVKLLTPTP